MKHLTQIQCDGCGELSECRFEYIDPHQDNLPMMFCTLDCLERYVRRSPPDRSHQGRTSEAAHN
jgi:hypothetical protein